jgi:hypothetical protein
MMVNSRKRNKPLLKAFRINMGNWGERRGPYIAKINAIPNKNAAS